MSEPPAGCRGGLVRALCVAMGLGLSACASAGALAPGADSSPPSGEAQLVLLAQEQAEEVERFDSPSAGEGRCERLRFHLDRICEISERICALVEAHPEADAGACERSQQTCDDTRDRLPEACQI